MTRHDIHRWLRRHRRVVAAGCTIGAVWAGLGVIAPEPPRTTPVTVAARDLPAGTAVVGDDVRTVELPPDAVPAGAVVPPPGALLAGPMRRGEPFTDARLAEPSVTRRPAGSVLIAVRTADPAAALVARPGDRVDVLAGPRTDGLAAAAAEVPTSDPLADASDASDASGAAGAAGAAGAGSDGAGSDGAGSEPAATMIGRDLLVIDVPGRPADPATAPATGSGSGLLGAVPAPESGTGSSVDLSGVLVLATDRATAARIAASAGIQALTVVVVSR